MFTRKNLFHFIYINLFIYGLAALPLAILFSKTFLPFRFEPQIDFDTSILLTYTHFLSIPLSTFLVFYKYRTKKIDHEFQNNLIPSYSNAALTFIKTFILLYGTVAVAISLMIVLKKGGALIGIWFGLCLLPILIFSLIAACIRLKNRKKILILLSISIIPLLGYNIYRSTEKRKFYNRVFFLQNEQATDKDWREFFNIYEHSLFGSKGKRNQLDLVLYIKSIPQDILMKYLDHPDTMIQWSLAKNPCLPIKKMKEYVMADEYLRSALAKNPNLPKEIIEILSSDKSSQVRESINNTLKTKNEYKPCYDKEILSKHL